MLRSRLGFLLCVAGLSLTLLAPASAAPAVTFPTIHVTIDMFAFSPAGFTSRLGTLVTWTNHDSVAHTTTSNEGFWSSPHLGTGASYSHRFNSAGNFPYHCAIHTDMHGRVSIPMRVTPQTGGGYLVWAIGAGRFDVQMERPGSTVWVTYRSATLARAATFRTTRHGRYLFRARTRMGSTASGWSPAVALTVR